MNDNEKSREYWDDVWSFSRSHQFASLNPTNNLPWDIQTHDKNLQHSLNLLNLTKGKVLEIGCGSGNDSKFLDDIGFNVTAMDISKNAIDIAKKNNQGKNINFVVGDILFDIPNEKYDLIYDRACLHNCQDRLFEIFKNLNSILTDDGKIIIIAGNINQPKRECTIPPSMLIGHLEHNCRNWFKIILVREIIIELNSDYENCLGNLFILERKKNI
jgi:SAM-dependent methyltransferase